MDCAARIAFVEEPASAVGLGNKTWHAVLERGAVSYTGNKPTDAGSRIGTGPWSNAKGIVVAKDLTELNTRKGDADLFLDERGQRVPGNGSSHRDPPSMIS